MGKGDVLDIKILYVDDSEVIREAKTAILRTIAKEVYEASNGREGIESYKLQQPDIVFTDVEMPELNGYEMSKMIKEIDPNAIIVAVTVHEETKELIRFIELGIENYLIKPVSAEKLIDTVKKIYTKLKMEKQLREEIEFNEKKFRSLVENIIDVIILSDNKGNITYTNYENREFLGYSPKERTEWKILDCLKEKFKELTIEMNKKERKGGGLTSNFEVDIPAKDGKIHLFEVSYIRLENSNNIEGVLINARDVTESRKNKREIIEAKEAAEAANEIKTHAIASISHEIRTPMNGIVGFVDLLNNTELSANQKFYVEKIKRSSDSLLRLTNNLLDFSKMEAQKTEIDKIEFNIFDIVEESLQTFSGKAKEKLNEIGLIVDKDVPEMLLGDPIKLTQVLNNIISNSIKFTENGEILIEVRRLTEADGKMVVLIKITDTGIGIKKENIRKIFNAFSQADATVGRKYGGTGLGLAISKKLIELMDGEINVESEFGKGTSFSIMIPFDEPKGILLKPKQERESKELKVAIFSERGIVRRVVAHYAQEEKCSVEEFTCFDKFMEKIRNVELGNEQIDLIFIDNCSAKERMNDIKMIFEKSPQFSNVLFVLAVDMESIQETSDKIAIIRKPLKRNDMFSVFKKF